MKKLLVALLMVLCLVVFAHAMAAEITIAEFDFDTEPETGWEFLTGANSVAKKIGNPLWSIYDEEHKGVLQFKGNDGLQFFY